MKSTFNLDPHGRLHANVARNPGTTFKALLGYVGLRILFQAMAIFVILFLVAVVLAHLDYCVPFFGIIISTKQTFNACHGIVHDQSVPWLWIYNL